MATVKSFLNKYKDPNGANQYALMDAFRRYLIASCWRKMHSRSIQWSYSGMIYHLHQISHAQVTLAFAKHYNSCSDTVSNDGLLLDWMGTFFDNEQAVGSLISSYPGVQSPFSALDVKYLRAPRRSERFQRGFTIYDETTCFEFHKLLIAALVGYAKGLKKLNTTPQADPVARAAQIMPIYFFASLLWA